MSAKKIVYPGTFDPITLGHMDLITRISALFDRVIVGVSASTRKSTLFSIDKRVELAKTVLKANPKVEVVPFEGLLVDFAQQLQATVILRGLRSASDLDYELQLAGMNQQMAPLIETIFMSPAIKYSFLSATLVREIAELGGDVSDFVHPEVMKALSERFRGR